MENNTCFIAKIGNFQPIEGADKIESASIILNDVPITRVVIGKGEHNEGDLVVYFDSNLCLSDEFILYIDKQHKDYGKENFTSVSRYLARGNRIKTVKLKGTISDGLVISPEKFENLLDSKTKKLFDEGFSFNDLGDMHICHKYVAPVKQQPTTGSKKDRKKRKLISRVIPEMFKFHCDTAQLAKNLFRISPNTVASISRKIHGCVSWDTVVDTLEYGKKQIKEIVDGKINCHIKALNTLTNEIVFANVDAFYKKENDGDWYEIELENGNKIKITGNNPVWLPRLNCYRKAEELTVNDYVLID